ncbi:hypothetical protein ACH5RR_025853 [Cinchona calisaya]|uniref:Uncharacterized protein n=1 Tax=Cinchona calisaya TaxID=153742 RepID=A0ABD2Z187_9GENT
MERPKVVAAKRGIKGTLGWEVLIWRRKEVFWLGETMGNTNQIMGVVPKELIETLPNKLMGIDNQKIQDVHMWFGGILRGSPWGHAQYPGSEVNFYFRHPDCTLDITTAYLKCDEDVKLWALSGTHTYGREYNKQHATSRYLAKKYLDKHRDETDIGNISFVKDVKRVLMVEISPVQAYKSKRKAKKVLQDCDGKDYRKLWEYCNVLRKKNLGSCSNIKLDRPTIEEKRIFQILYYRLSTWKDGFLAGCRPIIGLDGCFLKGPFGG